MTKKRWQEVQTFIDYEVTQGSEDMLRRSHKPNRKKQEKKINSPEKSWAPSRYYKTSY